MDKDNKQIQNSKETIRKEWKTPELEKLQSVKTENSTSNPAGPTDGGPGSNYS